MSKRWPYVKCQRCSNVFSDVDPTLAQRSYDIWGMVTLMRLQSTFVISTTPGKTQAMIQTSSRL